MKYESVLEVKQSKSIYSESVNLKHYVIMLLARSNKIEI